MTLIVCPLRFVPLVIANRSPSHLITLLSPEELIDTPPGIARERHLRLGVHDIDVPQAGMTAPGVSTVEKILEFGAGWDEQAPMLIHCWAGISRSTATAFVLACERSPDTDEYRIAMEMRRVSPQAFPNRRIVALADDILGRRGRMVRAVEAMGGNNFVPEGVTFEIPARRPAA